MLTSPFEYRKLGDFTYNVLSDPGEIKSYLMKWIMSEWEFDHNEAPEEHWTVAWMEALPKMEFTLQVIRLDDICPNADLWGVAEFQTGLRERADERELSLLRGVSIEPLLVNRNGFELMDGYTRYTVLKRYEQEEVYAYMGLLTPPSPAVPEP
ncbi:MAG TPA: hypothetical protein VFY66_09735 [Anaerolineales bacterium]|nr:hypothetical protein [Anaerolineales bacterium]